MYLASGSLEVILAIAAKASDNGILVYKDLASNVKTLSSVLSFICCKDDKRSSEFFSIVKYRVI